MQEALEIGHSLGLNATTDSDLSWVVQEYMAAPLPGASARRPALPEEEAARAVPTPAAGPPWD